jgi:uncharacterized metal-binding protein
MALDKRSSFFFFNKFCIVTCVEKFHRINKKPLEFTLCQGHAYKTNIQKLVSFIPKMNLTLKLKNILHILLNLIPKSH